MAKLETAVRRPSKVPEFVGKVLARKGGAAAPPPAATSTKAPPASAPVVRVLPAIQPTLGGGGATGKGGAPAAAGKTSSGAGVPAGGNLVHRKRLYLASHGAHATNVSAVHQAKDVQARRGIEAGGTAKTAVHKDEAKSYRNRQIGKRSPLVQKNPAPPTGNLRVGKRVITSAFQQTRFHTPFQKNVNLRRLTGIY